MIKNLHPLKALIVLSLLAKSLSGQAVGIKQGAITPVAGESWLKHLHKSFDATSMGRTWDVGPSATMPWEESSHWQPALTPGFAANSVILHGVDLYRLNCRGCHGVSGMGNPPEINSVINPVRATSVAVLMERANSARRVLSCKRVACFTSWTGSAEKFSRNPK